MKNKIKHKFLRSAVVIVLSLAILLVADITSYSQPKTSGNTLSSTNISYNTVRIDGLDIFYREAGKKSNPIILLLHGFPTSSFMFRNLIPALADRYHIVAPDYPGFGGSSVPDVKEFNYSFDNLADVIDKFTVALSLKKYSLYVQDYGAPVGFRLAAEHPERIQSLIVQNGNAYEEGLRDFWKPLKAYWKNPSVENANALRPAFTLESLKWQYTHGTKNPQNISPDNWLLDHAGLSRPGREEIQLKLFFDYGSNPALYPIWQAYFRRHQPPALIVWGKNDQIFPAEGAEPYKRDLKNLDFHLLDTGHFALEENGDEIAGLIRKFLAHNLAK